MRREKDAAERSGSMGASARVPCRHSSHFGLDGGRGEGARE